RKLGAVFAQPEQLEARAHGAYARFGEVTAAMSRMVTPETLRHEQLHPLTNELIARVAEQLFGLRVYQQDAPVSVHDDHRVWRGFEQTAELRFGLLAFADVPDRTRHERLV